MENELALVEEQVQEEQQEDNDSVATVSFTEATRNLVNEEVRLPWYSPELRKQVDENLDSIYEIAAANQKPLIVFIQDDPEYAVMCAEMSYAKWTNVLTQVALTGVIASEEGNISVSKNQIKALELRVKQAKTELGLVTDYALSIDLANGRKRDQLLRTLYMNAVMHRDTKALIYLIDRLDGRPGESRIAELSYDNAYNIYMILHTLFDKQLSVLNAGSGTIMVCCSRRAGKCWSPDTLLRKYDGTLVMAKDVVVGDVMMGAHNEPQTVLSTTSGTDDMYRITSNKDNCLIDFKCNSVHVLTVKFVGDLSNTRSAYKNVYKNNSVYDIPLNEFLTLPKSIQQKFRLWRQRTEYNEVEHIIDPYIFGLWLGDGSKSIPEFAVGFGESEIENELLRYADRNCFDVSIREQIRDKGTCKGIRINSGKIIPNEMRRLNITDNKHIPHEYLIDSVDNRLKLLAGLIDSDGCVDSRSGQCIFSNTDINIVRGVIELCNSLGYKVTVSVQDKKYFSEAHNTIQTCEIYNVCIKGTLSEIPTLCPRKKMLDSKQPCQYGFKIEYIGKGQYNGFTLDGDGRLLLSDYTVTHNTHMLVAATLIECMRKPNTTCIYIGETMELTEGLVDDATNKIVDACHLQDKRGKRFNWRRMDNGSKILVRGLSNTKDPDQIRGNKAKVIVIDEFFHLKSDLLEYLQREVLQPMQMDYADDYKFLCAGTPPQIKGTYGEYAWKNWEVPHFTWTWEDNPHPVNVEARRAYVEKAIEEKGLTWDTPFVRREYLGEWAYDDDLLLYPNYKVYDPNEGMPQWKISRVLFGVDYGVSDNDTIVGIAWSDDEGKGYQFFETKFSRLDIKDRTMSQLEFLKQEVMRAWKMALDYFPCSDTESAKQANKRILWDSDDNDQHVTQELALNCKFDDDMLKPLTLQIANAHKTDKKIMWDKIDELMRTGRLLIIKGSKLEQECVSTILARGPNGEIYSEVDDKVFHPDLLPAMRYCLWNVLAV